MKIFIIGNLENTKLNKRIEIMYNNTTHKELLLKFWIFPLSCFSVQLFWELLYILALNFFIMPIEYILDTIFHEDSFFSNELI